MKKRFLVTSDYGMGANWLFIYAHDAEQIMRLYPELKVVEEPPSWLRGKVLRNIEKNLTFDIDSSPTGLLAALIKERD